MKKVFLLVVLFPVLFSVETVMAQTVEINGATFDTTETACAKFSVKSGDQLVSNDGYVCRVVGVASYTPFADDVTIGPLHIFFFFEVDTSIGLITYDQWQEGETPEQQGFIRLLQNTKVLQEWR